MNKAMQICEALEDKHNDLRIKNQYESGIVMGIQICVEAIRDLPADPVSGDALARLMAENERLRLASSALLNRYVELINSGDCGNWDSESEPEVIEMRAALKGEPK